MAARPTSEVIQHLRRAVLLRDGSGLTDGQLLGCFIEQRDDDAFADLVRRHGPMVWGVCRRVLQQHDAEDAFQATFLVLVRKAASVVPRERVGNWLYGVAHQTALQSQKKCHQKKREEKQVTQMPERAIAEQDLWPDLQPLLDRELSPLPYTYREVIVLCDLEGKTRKEVARQLGLPEGTVGSRLARARVMLAKRLARRGVAFSGGALAAVLSLNVASASVPTSIVPATIKAASLFAAGQATATGAISIKVAALTEGALKAMFVTKLLTATAVLLVVALVGIGGGTTALLAGDQDGQVTTGVPVAPKDEHLGKVKELLEQAINWYDVLPSAAATVRLRPEIVLRWQNPVRIETGAAVLAIWTDQGRPAAMASIFEWDGQICHEFGSLSRSNTLVARDRTGVIWSPSIRGVDFRYVPDAPTPAATAAARLRQMKTLAERFSAKLSPDPNRGAKHEVLRLLPKPLYRDDLTKATRTDPPLRDGGMFAFAMGTDPEVVLLLEAVERQNKTVWQYAFARATAWPAEASLGDRVVWSVGRNSASGDLRSTLIQIRRPFYYQRPK